jgi:hypothetical protein
MATIPGARCAAVLVAMNLPLNTVVQELMGELGLTYEEANLAALDALRAHVAAN